MNMRNALGVLRPATPGVLVALVLVLTLQALAVRRVSITEVSIPLPGLHNLPLTLGPWHASEELELSSDVTNYLQPDEYILRDYRTKDLAGTVNLFVAYFKSLQNTYGPHSPAVCLPGSGWMVRSSHSGTINLPSRPGGLDVNEYEMERSGDRIYVMFWYQNDRGAWAAEWDTKLRMLPDLLRYRRSDISLVRLIAPVRGQTSGSERASTIAFAAMLYADLSDRFAKGR